MIHNGSVNHIVSEKNVSVNNYLLSGDRKSIQDVVGNDVLAIVNLCIPVNKNDGFWQIIRLFESMGA